MTLINLPDKVDQLVNDVGNKTIRVEYFNNNYYSNSIRTIISYFTQGTHFKLKLR